MNWIELLDEQTARTLGWTLVHSLWQGGVVALLLFLIWPWAKRISASTRYGVCALALALIALIPVVTFGLLMSSSARPRLEPVTASRPVTASLEVPRALGRVIAGPVRRVGTSSLSLPMETWNNRVVPLLAAAWATGVLLLSVRRIGAWLWMRRVLRSIEAAPSHLIALLQSVALRAGVKRFPSLGCTSYSFAPCVIGWLRPVILLPIASITGLSTKQMEALLAHELAHIRRHDYLVNLLQTAVETLLFFHPVVWWIGRQLRVEREHCCDDLAVQISGDRMAYARVLVDLAGQGVESAFAVGVSGGSLSARVRRLLTGELLSRPPLWPALLTLALCMPILFSTGRARPVTMLAQSVPQEMKPDLMPIAPEKATGREGRTEEPARPHRSTPHPSERVLSDEIQQMLESDEYKRVQQSSMQQAREQLSQLRSQLAQTDSESAENLSAQIMAQLYALDKAAREQVEQITKPHDDWLGGIMHSGLRNLSIEDLIQLRTHGVSTELARAVLSAYPNASAKDVCDLRDHGLDAGFVNTMRRDLGDISLRDLIRLRDHGIQPDYVTRMRSLLGARLGMEELIRLRTHGVDPDYVERIKRNGFPDVTADQLIRMREAGI